MAKIIFDARKINDSGIGTVIKNSIPEITKRYRLTLAGPENVLRKMNFTNVEEIIDFNYPGYSLTEQIKYFTEIPECDLFISPHYNVPFFAPQIKKLISIVHDTYHLEKEAGFNFIKRTAALMMIKRAVKRSNKIITVSNFSLSRLKYFTGVSEEKVIVNHCGINHNIYSKEYDRGELQSVKEKYSLPDNFVLFIGNLKPNKNLKNLLTAMHEVIKIKDDLFLVVVGKKDGFITADNVSLQMLENDKELQKKVHFTGYVDDLDLPVIIKCAQMLAFPSFYEGFGLPPLEAMSSGIPVTASNCPAVSEVCSDAVLYFDPAEPDEIAKNIIRIYNDEELRNTLTERGINQARKYNWETFGEKFNEIIGSLI